MTQLCNLIKLYTYKKLKKNNMEEVKKKYDIGVIIGRFQIDDPHVGHEGVIEHVLDNYDRSIIFLGVAPAIGTRKNAVDYTSRKKMLEEKYGDRIEHIYPLHDMKFNCQWAKSLETKIREIYPTGSVMLFGSRKSFIDAYTPHGKFSTTVLEAEVQISASEIRSKVKNKSRRTSDFRAGMIYAANISHPFNYATIDVAIFNDDYSKVLLGRKKYESTFRFVGGFSDVTDTTYEQTAKREAYEETNLEIGDITYVCSRKVDDWRYRGEEDRGIITTFFMAKRVFGAEKAKDDIEELRWVDVNDLEGTKLVDEHQHLKVDLIKRLVELNAL